jgi:hypothetical protein
MGGFLYDSISSVSEKIANTPEAHTVHCDPTMRRSTDDILILPYLAFPVLKAVPGFAWMFSHLAGIGLGYLGFQLIAMQRNGVAPQNDPDLFISNGSTERIHYSCYVWS